MAKMNYAKIMQTKSIDWIVQMRNAKYLRIDRLALFD